MAIVIGVFVFLYGMALGSFYNVVALRMPKGESIVRPRSHCVNCSHPLGVKDLVPIFSYLFLRGKCRNCGVKISPLYCLFETITAFGFLISYGLYGLTPLFFLSITLLSLLVIISLSDLVYYIIPDRVLLFFFILLLVENIGLSLPTSLSTALIGSALGFGLLFFIAVLSKGGMGGGDVKLYAVLGLALGWKLTLLSLFLASLLGVLYGIYARVSKKLEKKQEIPFGPFIAIAAMLSLWFGEACLELYMQLF